jgi:hypothetical protein
VFVHVFVFALVRVLEVVGDVIVFGRANPFEEFRLLAM